MLETFLKLETLIFTLFAIYLAYCSVDLVLYEPLEMKTTSIVVDHKGTTKKIDPVIKVKPEDIIVVEVEATRSHHAFNSVERILKNNQNGKETVIDYIKRPQKPGKVSLVVNYEIPRSVERGCKFTVYSRNSITYQYNILTYVFPAIVEGPKLDICIE